MPVLGLFILKQNIQEEEIKKENKKTEKIWQGNEKSKRRIKRKRSEWSKSKKEVENVSQEEEIKKKIRKKSWKFDS